VICYGGVLLKTRLGYDDALDAFRRARRRLDLLSKQAIGVVAAGGVGSGRHLHGAQGERPGDRPPGRRRDRARRLDDALHGESAYASPGPRQWTCPPSPAIRETG
jgi:hypothetical protein